MSSIAGTAEDFSRLRRHGARNRRCQRDPTPSLLSSVGNGPEAQLIDPGYNLKLSVIALTPDITSMRVIAPAEKPWVSIGPNTNLEHPFGPEWDNPETRG